MYIVSLDTYIKADQHNSSCYSMLPSASHTRSEHHGTWPKGHTAYLRFTGGRDVINDPVVISEQLIKRDQRVPLTAGSDNRTIFCVRFLSDVDLGVIHRMCDIYEPVCLGSKRAPLLYRESFLFPFLLRMSPLVRRSGKSKGCFASRWVCVYDFLFFLNLCYGCLRRTRQLCWRSFGYF